MDIFVNVFAACSNILMIISRGPQNRHSSTTVDLLIINWQNIEMLMEMLLDVCFEQTENILNISGVLTLEWKQLKF